MGYPERLPIMFARDIFINETGFVIPLGENIDEVTNNILENNFVKNIYNLRNIQLPYYSLTEKTNKNLDIFKNLPAFRNIFKKIDNSSLFSAYCIDKICKELFSETKSEINSDLYIKKNKIGVCIGSARGATSLLESGYNDFNNSSDLNISPYTSPSTTSGNISSISASILNYHIDNQNILELFTSMTCVSSFHSIINSLGLMRSGIVDTVLCGGTEAPITPFTFSQMYSLGIYSKLIAEKYSSIPFNGNINTLCLGEGCTLFLLESKRRKNTLAKIFSIGFGFEKITSLTGITPNGDALYCSMRNALLDSESLRSESLNSEFKYIKNVPDLIISHSPGTLKGDSSELNAIKRVFKKNIPLIFSTKHLTGHTFGASGAVSILFAILIIQKRLNLEQILKTFPYDLVNKDKEIKDINTILINSTGFGGNAISILLSK